MEFVKQPEVNEAASVILTDLQQYLGNEAGKDNLYLCKENFIQDMLVAFARVIAASVG